MFDSHWLTKSSQILYEKGPFVLARRIQAHLPVALYKIIHRISHIYKPFKYTSADPLKIILVDPMEIWSFKESPIHARIKDSRITFGSGGRFHELDNIGYVVEGDWDLEIKPKEGVFEQAVNRHFHEGVPWEETVYFEQMLEKLSNEGYVWKGIKEKSKSEVLEKLQTYDKVYHSIKEEGYQRSQAEGIIQVPKDFDEITLCIGRNGRLIHNSSGYHRLAIAKALGLEAIPAQILIRHRTWEKTRQQTEDSPSLSEYRGHPDLE